MKRKLSSCLYRRGERSREQKLRGPDRAGETPDHGYQYAGEGNTGSRVSVRGTRSTGTGEGDQRITGTGASSFMVRSVTAQS